MTNKLSLTFTPEKFADFVSKLKDLASIDDCLKLKIEKDVLLMYTMKTANSTVLALKSFSLKTSDYFEYEEDFTLDYIICNSTKLIKSLSIFFIGDVITDKVKLDLSIYKDANGMQVRNGLFSSGKLKISHLGSEFYKIRDVDHLTLEAKLDPDMCQWDFTVNKADLTSVKKLSSIYTLEATTIQITIENGIVSFSEGIKWELNVGVSDDKDYHNLTFVKKYLSNIDDSKEDIRFYVYDVYILIKDDNSNLMLSFEQSFED